MLVQAYLASPRARRALATRPGEAGFSLIELVVVIAILGILIAIALPNFLNVRKDAQISQAKNSLASVIKECAVSEAREKGTSLDDATSANANLGSYVIYPVSAVASAGAITWDANPYVKGTSANTSCFQLGARYAPGGTLSNDLPDFGIATTSSTGETIKACRVGAATTYNDGACTLASGASAPANGTW